VLLGGTHAIDGGRDFAVAVALQAMSVARGVDVLREMARDPAALRCAIKGSGVVGDPKLVHWLIRQMAAPQMARVAGEAFTLITGADLSALRLELDEAIKPAAGPSDEPGDDDVAMDADDDLPWPDAEKVERWWMANAHAFSKGSRHLLGVRASSSHCVEILRSGFQRQRLLAAQQRSLSEPGTPVFNTRAPSWRQQRWLAALAG
jgi:uncharacterized protein (TIGR02270 family)